MSYYTVELRLSERQSTGREKKQKKSAFFSTKICHIS